MTLTSVPSILLREPARLISELKNQVDLGQKAFALFLVTFGFLAIYGGVIGASSSGIQSGVTAIKLPLLFLETMLICLPTLHVLNLLFGSRHSFGQLAVLILASLAATATILVAFLPISAFFLMTSDSYSFFKILNVCILAVAAFYGVRFMSAGMKHLQEGLDEGMAAKRASVLRTWIVLYAFVGSQLAWVMRPFFGDPALGFQVFRSEKGNFYLNIIQAFLEIFGLK